ncbi:hypothetical protein ACOMHN_018479 [Nucella lapillus]
MKSSLLIVFLLLAVPADTVSVGKAIQDDAPTEFLARERRSSFMCWKCSCFCNHFFSLGYPLCSIMCCDEKMHKSCGYRDFSYI